MLIALLKKEWLELFRDKRSMLATFAYAFFGPVLLFIVLKGLIATITSTTQVKVGIYQQHPKIDYIEQFLNYKQIQTQYIEGEAETALGDGLVDIVLQVNKSSTASGYPLLNINVFGDSQDSKGEQQLKKMQQVMNSFLAQENTNSLLKQGGNPFSSDWQVNVHEVNQHTMRGKRLLDSLLIFLLLSPFIISLNYINDATAGERERGSLMPLLSQPVARMNIVVSKWLVGGAVGIIGTAITMVLGFNLINSLPLYELDMQIHWSLSVMLFGTCILLPLALLVTALQMLVAITAKTYKEGQSYLTILSFLPMLAVFMSDKWADVSFAHLLPLIGQQQLLQQIFSGQTLNLAATFTVSLFTIALALMCLLAVRVKLNQENIIFER
ncbi:hypothetical protein A9Q98_15200 [Thalassotalea sp. 42_200_T64]|nr:hypothetical protein A9Q98_15200 [Thalassotalea sp. 42_200_T64]